MCIERKVLKTMNEKEEDDPVLHKMEEIRDVAKFKKKKVLFTESVIYSWNRI